MHLCSCVYTTCVDTVVTILVMVFDIVTLKYEHIVLHEYHKTNDMYTLDHV